MTGCRARAPERGDLGSLAALVVAAAAIAAYLPALGNGFVFDDSEYVVTNRFLHQSFPRVLTWAFTAFYSANWHPLTWLSHYADVALFGLKPRGHHLVNILLHAANAVLLLRLLRATTGALWRSALVAGLFALHPLHVESVAWVSARKDLLSGFFFLLTLSAYARYAARPSWQRYAPPLCLFALGLMAKPMLVTVPFVLLLVDGWPLGRWRRAPAGTAGSGTLALLAEKLPYLALSAASCVVTVYAQRAWGAIKDVRLDTQLANIPVAYAGYLAKTVWPAGLAFFYPLPVAGIPWWKTAGSLALLLALTACVVRFGHRRRWLAVGWLWYLGMLVPVVGFVKVGLQSMADRYTYLPLIGPFIIVAWSAGELAGRRRGAPRILAAAAALGHAAFGILASVQAGYWRSDATLSSHALAVTTDNWMAHNNLALEVYRQGRVEEALAHVEQALSANRWFPEAWYSKGLILSERRRTGEALSAFEHALALNPEFIEARMGRAIALAALSRPEEALAEYQAVLARDPEHEVARVNLANILDDLGRSDEAIAQYREALRRDPRSELAHYNLGVVFKKVGRWPEARSEFEETLRLDPGHQQARYNLQQLPPASRN